MGYVRVPVKVKTKKEENKKLKKAANVSAQQETSNELSEPRWSVVTFEACAASNLTYAEAVAEMEKLAAKRVSGLCIVTDEAAKKIAGNK